MSLGTAYITTLAGLTLKVSLGVPLGWADAELVFPAAGKRSAGRSQWLAICRIPSEQDTVPPSHTPFQEHQSPPQASLCRADHRLSHDVCGDNLTMHSPPTPTASIPRAPQGQREPQSLPYSVTLRGAQPMASKNRDSQVLPL